MKLDEIENILSKTRNGPWNFIDVGNEWELLKQVPKLLAVAKAAKGIDYNRYPELRQALEDMEECE